MADTTTPTPASPALKRRKKKWIIAGLAAGSLIFLLLILVALLPMLISGGLLRGAIQSTADDMIVGSVTWDKLNLAWGRGQSIEGLKILDAQGNVLLRASRADAPDVSLRALALGSRDLGRVILTIDQADIVQESDGQLNIIKALEFVEPVKPRTPYPAPLEGWTAVAHVKASGIRIQPLDAPAIEIPTLDIQADLSDPGAKIDLAYQLMIQQGSQPAGQSQGSVTLHNLFNATGDLQLALTTIQAQAKVETLPVSLIAALAGQDQKLEAALGSQADASLSLDGPVMNPQGQLTLQTPALTVETQLASTADTLEVTPGRVMHFRLSPQAWQAWSADPAMQLEQPMELEVQVRQLVMPRKGLAFDWPTVRLDLQVMATPLQLRGSEQAGRLSLTDVQMAIQSEALGRRVAINAQAAAARNEHQGRFSLNAQLSDLMDAQGQIDLRQLQASLDMEAADLPVALADQLLASPGKYETLIGPSLQARAKATIEPGASDAQEAAGPFELTFNSDHLQGRIVGSLEAQALTVKDESRVMFRLTPQGAAAAGLPADMLQSPASIQLTIRQASIPRRDNTLALEQARANVTLTSEPLTLAGIGQFQSMRLSDLQVAVSTQALGQEVNLTASLNTQADGRTGSLSAQGVLHHLLTTTPSSTQPAMEASFKAQARRFPVAILEGFTGQVGSIEPWVGGLLDVDVQAQTTQGQSSWLEQGSTTLRLQSDLLQADVVAIIDQGILRVQPASQIEMQLATDALETQGITFAKPVKVTIKPGRITLPVSPMNLDDVVIEQLTLQTTPIEPAGDLALTGYSIAALQGQLASPRLGDQLALNIDGKISRPDVADSPLMVKANLRQPLSDQVTGQGQILLEQVAVPVVDMILKQGGLLTDTLGPLVEKLEVNLQSEGGPVTNGAAWRYQMALQASHVNIASLKGRFTPGQQVEVEPGAAVQLKLTPALYARLMAEPAKNAASGETQGVSAAGGASDNPIRSILGAVLPPRSAAAKVREQQSHEAYILASPADVVLTINGAKLNLASSQESSASEPAAMDLSDVSFDASLAINELVLTRTTAGDTHRLRDLKAVLQTEPDAARAVHVKVVGQTTSEPQVSSQPGSLDVDLTLHRLSMLPQGGINWYDADIRSRIKLEHFPTALIDHLASQQGRLTSLLGASMQSQITGRVPGEMDVSLQSPQSSLTALLVIDEQRIIRLRDDVTLELTPTPEAVAVMGLINPQLLALESTRDPVSLVVRKAGFELPMPRPGQPLDLQRVHSELTLNLGQVRLRREGIVKDVFDVLAGVGGKFATHPIMDVRFTPLEVKLDQGQLTTNDLWMVSQDLVMGTQARVDMTRANMPAVVHVGLSGQTLRQLPGARNNLPADLVVDVRLAAPLSEIKLDKTAMAVQITPLLVTAYGGREGLEVLQGVSQGVSLLERLAGRKPADTQGVTWLNHPEPEALPQGVTTQPAETQPATTQPTATQPATQPAQQQESQKDSPIDRLDDLFNRIRKR